MAKGAFWIEADVDPLIVALKRTEHGMKDLRKAYLKVAEIMQDDVQRRVPVYGGQHSEAKASSRGKDSKSHPPPGFLRATTKKGASQRGGARVSIGGKIAPYHMMQEFGGGVFWHKSGAGAIRSTNRAHRKLAEAAASAGVKGHIIYTKPRRRTGYFIWNVVYRRRSDIGRTLVGELHDVCRRNGLVLDVSASNLDLGFKPMNEAP